MIKAAALIGHTTRPVKHIALQFGYTDVSNFHRDFKKVHATTPRAFRTRELTQWLSKERARETSTML